MFGAKSISKLFLGSMLLIMPAGSFAYVDDAGIMDHFNYANDQCLYDYLNQNDYKFYSKDRWSDAYLKKDHSLFMTISNNPLAGLRRQSGLLYTILIMKPGYQTDKGIEVGMSLEQVIAAYGELLYSGDVDKYRNIPNTGYALEGTYTFKTKYGDQERFKYYMISYFDLDSHWVEFLVDKLSKKVKAIGYFYGDPRSGISNNRDLVYELNDWGLWPIVLADRINEHPLKSSWPLQTHGKVYRGGEIMKKTFDKPLDGQKQPANGKNDTAYIYRILGMAEKLDRAEKELGIPFKSLDDVAK